MKLFSTWNVIPSQTSIKCESRIKTYFGCLKKQTKKMCSLFILSQEDAREHDPQKWRSQKRVKHTASKQGIAADKRRKGFPKMRVREHSMTSAVQPQANWATISDWSRKPKAPVENIIKRHLHLKAKELWGWGKLRNLKRMK